MSALKMYREVLLLSRH